MSIKFIQDFKQQNFSTSIQVVTYRNLTIKPRAPVAEARKVDCGVLSESQDTN